MVVIFDGVPLLWIWVEDAWHEATVRVPDNADSSDPTSCTAYDCAYGRENDSFRGVDGAGPCGVADGSQLGVGFGCCSKTQKSRTVCVCDPTLIRAGGKGSKQVGGKSAPEIKYCWFLYMESGTEHLQQISRCEHLALPSAHRAKQFNCTSNKSLILWAVTSKLELHVPAH
jgi:hypothetical protein